MTRKKTTRKRTTKKRTVRKAVELPEKSKEPSYMVRVSDPKAVRKDTLEALREVILVMQAYEEFRRIQAEKKELFAELKGHLKEINNLVDGKLKFYLPKGKLAVHKHHHPEDEPLEADRPMPAKKKAPVKRILTPEQKERKDLHALEKQLASIEEQLQNIA